MQPNQSQCYVRLPFTDLGDSQWRLEDLIGDATYDREGNDLQARGLYLDEPPWQGACFLADEKHKESTKFEIRNPKWPHGSKNSK